MRLKCNALNGASADSMLLILVRLVTMCSGLVMTRLLADHFSLQVYGTYSQALLLVTTLATMTSFGLMDGISYFYWQDQTEKNRNAYISTIFVLQYLLGLAAAAAVVLLRGPICRYFQNEDLRPLILVAAFLPMLQNAVYLMQILFFALGKGRLIAVRNLVVSLLKLAAILVTCYVVDDIRFLLTVQLLLELLQGAYFCRVLDKYHCRPRLRAFSGQLIRRILAYCIPMAMFTVVKALNRDCDKFVISFFMDTESLAVYANASRQLPFDIIMASFCTVLQPYVTGYIARKDFQKAASLYRAFLELSLVSTAILALSAVAAAPELMQLLFTEKYLTGLPVFRIYILIDILTILCGTLVLSAIGRTKTVLYISISVFLLNVGLDVLLYRLLGMTGPAWATLLVTVIQGVLIVGCSARVMGLGLRALLPVRTMLIFSAEAACLLGAISCLRRQLASEPIPYVLRLLLYGAGFGIPMLMLSAKTLKKTLDHINSCKKNTLTGNS